MLTGINFSPPLYFLLNFFIQLFFPTSIEFLRVQSLIWALIGLTITFLLTRKCFGLISSLLASALIVSQSDLLIMQAQEARHYTMFFAFAGLVLFLVPTKSNQASTKSNHILTFLAHFCLCQIHYLGIIYSGFVGLAFFILDQKEESNWFKRIPKSILFCWILNVPLLIKYIDQQQSILNSWLKPNGISDLLSIYNQSLSLVSVVLPIVIILVIVCPKSIPRIGRNQCSHFPELTTLVSIFWLLSPLFFWVISHTSSMNIFYDRYFIPMEAAIIFLISLFFKFLLSFVPEFSNSSLTTTIIVIFSIMLLILNYNRNEFSLRKEINYHHSLLLNPKLNNAKNPIFFRDDPSFFPNAYTGKYNCVFLVENHQICELYKSFSKRIDVVSFSD